MGNCLGFLRRTGVRRRLIRRSAQTELQQVQPRLAPIEEVIVVESSSTTSLREPSPSRGDGNDDSVVSKTGVIPAIPTQGMYFALGIGLMIVSSQISPTSASSAPGHHVPSGKQKQLPAEPLTPVVHEQKDSDVGAESSKGNGAGETEAGDTGNDGGGDGGGEGGD
jgi:hypothetical protein